MLLFGHIGITAGVARACDIIISAAEPGGSRLIPWLGRVKNRIGQVDYRLVLLGSLLPDIIDKPVFLLVGGVSLSGRDYAHSLLFSLVLLIAGLVLILYGKSRLLTVSLSALTHLIFDQIYNNPVTLFWPLLGPLSGGEVASWLPGVVFGLFNYPGAYIPEITGLLIVLLFAYRLVKRKGVTSFIREGVIT
ncbi:MAG: metal-dependent hydrolase [Dehalococcoidales bacterium]